MSLSADQVDQYERRGYLIVDEVLTDREVEDFLDHQASPSPHADLGLRRHTALGRIGIRQWRWRRLL